MLAALGVLSPSRAQEPPATAEAQPPEAPAKPSPGPVHDLLKSVQDPIRLADLSRIERRVQQLIERVGPATVAVHVGGAAASGVVISPDGLVLTAAHVSGGDRGSEVRFTFPDGRTTRGLTLGANHAVDSGLMQIVEEGPWPYAEVADAEGAEPGDWVVALGHPGGFDPDRSLVARLGRIIRITSREVRTDCTIVGGDSGGPLFDIHGRVVGIHSRISDSVAANFHVPISTYLSTWQRLAGGEHWGDRRRSRAWAGMWGIDHPEGCLLHEISENGPAFKAGLKVGDILTRMNSKPVEDYSALVEMLAETEPGEHVTVEIIRDGQELGMLIVVEERQRGRGRGSRGR